MKQVQWIRENIPDVQVRMQPTGQSKDPHLGCECEISTEKKQPSNSEFGGSVAPTPLH